MILSITIFLLALAVTLLILLLPRNDDPKQFKKGSYIAYVDDEIAAGNNIYVHEISAAGLMQTPTVLLIPRNSTHGTFKGVLTYVGE